MLAFVRTSLALGALFAAGALVACSVETVTGPLEPSPSSTGTATGTPSSTAVPSASASAADASTADAAPAKDAGNGKDVLGSAECTAWCDAKVAAGCRACDSLDCQIAKGSCDAAERAYLDCQAKTGRFSCTSGGMSIVHSCKRDLTLCD